MDAAQRAVFQGIVYYYRENQVLCRYQASLRDPVDPVLLQEALDAARPLAEYYFCRVVWEKREAHLEPNDAPCRVRQGSVQPRIPEETEDYLFSLGWEGDTIYLDWFHFLADGRGGSPFFTLLLSLYCNLKYDAGFACGVLASDPPYDVEELLARFPDSQVANDLQKDVLQISEGTPHFLRLRMDRQSLVDLAVRGGRWAFQRPDGADLSGRPALSGKGRADLQLRRRYPRRAGGAQRPVQLHRVLPTVPASGAGSPAPRLCPAAGSGHPAEPDPGAPPVPDGGTDGLGLSGVPPESRPEDQKEDLPDGRVHQRVPRRFLGQLHRQPLLPRSPELEQYLTDFQTWVLPDGASLAMEVTSLHGVLTCCIENKVDRPGYLEALRSVLEQEGVRVLEAVQLS